MGRRFEGNRQPINRMQAKRRRMRHLYLKGLEERSYMFYMDTVPDVVVAAVKEDIRRRFRIIRLRVWLRTVQILLWSLPPYWPSLY